MKTLFQKALGAFKTLFILGYVNIKVMLRVIFCKKYASVIFLFSEHSDSSNFYFYFIFKSDERPT